MHAQSSPEASPQDQQYASIRDAIADGRITRFAQLLDYLPGRDLMTLLELDQENFNTLIQEPELLQVKQLLKLANLFKVDFFHLVAALTGRPA